MQTTPGPLDDAAIPAYLRALDVPGIADVHVHFMPQNVLDKVWAFFDRIGDDDGRASWGIAYRTAEPERVATLERLGVIAYPTLNYAHRPGMAAWLNAYSHDFADAHPQAVPSGTFYAEPSATADTEAALAYGARIFKIHVQVGEFAPDDPILDGAWSALERARVPAVVHCGSGPHRGRHTGPEPIAALLRRHPDLSLIIAHGGMPEYAAFTDLVEQYAGVCLDTTMVCTDYARALAPVPDAVLARWQRLPDKIVLGTDFPNIPYPYAHQIRVLADLGFGDDWMRAVLWRNGARLMRVPAP
ncbi:amidohydrolase family protein [Microbacterium terrisoli]|jgi:hypothetical protein|uniref:amidohydrolase family protein n=1 Tax=Microbacterium terrisoli TaxID=3242192 RepID=UPI00280625CA|nr:amidohydrolase family protein [Microbacterium protaetiae]